MKKAGLTEEQIVGTLQAHEVGVKTADPRRKHGISQNLIGKELRESRRF